MKQLILPAEVAAAATTRRLCDFCGAGGSDAAYITNCPQCYGRPAMLLRFVPVTDKPCGACATYQHDASYHDPPYTEGERIQIAARCVHAPHGGHYADGTKCPGHRVVGTATVARVLPITVDFRLMRSAHIQSHGDKAEYWPQVSGDRGPFHPSEDLIDLSDHLPFVTFTPGGTAIELTDVEATP